MSAEIQIRLSISINKGNLQFQSYPQGFQADMAGQKGPVPGVITVAVTHTEVYFTQAGSGCNAGIGTLVQPGYCWIQNLDQTNFVIFGIYDADTITFFPLGELLPGELTLFRLSRYLGQELKPGTGTGIADMGTSFLSFKADIAPCNVMVLEFDT